MKDYFELVATVLRILMIRLVGLSSSAPLNQSAQRTNENSPPIYRWDQMRIRKPVVREADG